ncbi:AAA family ATPase [Helicobacter saguini]|uniref:AAA family ATPase n=2 Tax=Helicobacter saguini TaxID=1548018 RepID=A0A347W0Q1_9HELI|nr:AAA family ATPase [Helicobacter saguini]MWV67802.1 AAA family ATPase [Helicobacter saguini]MWV70730.1 AAA family ATPase [Helicobacter saguini]MWV72633.1 AAA family ATPase [Helicobacter saguini]TLD94613.1 ATP-binding protein [Helicobacter saguini]
MLDFKQDSINKCINNFKVHVESILNESDYDFGDDISDLSLLVVLNKEGSNDVQVKQKRELNKKEEVGVSLLLSRLQNRIKTFLDSINKDSNVKIKADFYLCIDCVNVIKHRISQDCKQKDSSQKNSNIMQNTLMNMNKNKSNEDSKIKLDLFPQTPRFKLEQIILDSKTKESLLDTILLLQKQHIIYDEWGFKEIDSIPKTIINFYGKPGTGKTMSANIIASELNKKIIFANYADIESKYVGDAPKNLVAAFDLAQESNAILFFDEADSFLGKRISNISQSSDQAINSMRSELLKLLEERPIIVIFATNLLDNYDKAFHSRILRSIEFSLPDLDTRKILINKFIPKALQNKGFKLSETQIENLAQISENFSGREIKNAVLNSLILALKNAENIPNFSNFEAAFKYCKDEFDKSHKSEIRNKELANKIDSNLKSGNYVLKEKDELKTQNIESKTN